MAISLQTYLNRQQALRTRMEKEYAPLVEQVLRGYIDGVIKVVKEKGIAAAQGMVHGDVVINGLTTVLRDLHLSAIVKATRKPVVSTKALPSFVRRVLDYLDKFLLNKVVLPISTNTIKEVDKILDDGIERGLGVNEMVKHLEDTELPVWRAKMIVRTEAIRAANVAQMIQADQSKWEMEKQWIAIEDTRTRYTHSHKGVDGERVDLYDAYSNGLMCPGDPNGSAAEVINCRCTQGFFAKRDEDGNLIPKIKRTFDLLTILTNAA